MKKTMVLALLVVVIIVGMTTPAYADRKAVSINIGKWTNDGYANVSVYHNNCDRQRYRCDPRPCYNSGGRYVPPTMPWPQPAYIDINNRPRPCYNSGGRYVPPTMPWPQPAYIDY